MTLQENDSTPLVLLLPPSSHRGMAIALSGQRIHVALTQRAGRLSFALFKRLRNANLPLLIAFVGALIMLMRALTGAGYDAADASASLESQNNLKLNSTSSFWNTYSAIGESRWARLRSGVADTLWRCPTLSEELTNSTQNGMTYTPGCLKAKLQNVVHARTVLLGGKVIAKDSTNFEVPSIPSLLSSSSPTSRLPPELEGLPPLPNADNSESLPTHTPANEDSDTRLVEDDAKQVMEEDRPRANWSPKHGDGSGSRRGFEVRRKPH